MAKNDNTVTGPVILRLAARCEPCSTGCQISAETTSSLDRSRLYVCYCDGIGCNASAKTALRLLALGFEVRELMGGLDWWKRDGYATEGFGAQAGTEIACGC
jgi:rhodanese-related sulfurtransferase